MGRGQSSLTISNADVYCLPSHISPVNPAAHTHVSTSPFFGAGRQVAPFKQGGCLQSITIKDKNEDPLNRIYAFNPKIET